MRMCQYSTIIDFEQWDFVEKGITKLKNILEGQPEQPFNSGDYMIFYTKVFEMCTQKTHSEQLHCSQQLYDKYRDTIQDYITSTVLPSLREKRDEFMLRELVKRWSNHKFMVQCLSKFFGYLDRHYVVQMSLPTVKEVGLICFRDLVYSELSGKVRDGVLSLINHEREGQQIDRTLLKNVLNIFVEIGMGELDYYTDDFEAAMLKETTAYYFRKASNWNLDHSCYYTLKGECLNLEVDRASHCLPPNSEWKLAEKVELAILSAFNFTRERKYDNLKEAKDIFGTDEVFRSSFTEILATCCDNILKKDTSKRLSDISIFETVEAAVKLLPYTCDKDLFAEFHREKLALRLLFDESASDKHERGILTKLKMDFGCEFTSKIERMVTDFTLATENEASFDEYLSNNPNANPGIDLTVTVLTKSFWPSYKSFDLNLPPEMVKCVRLFEKFYQTKTKNRNLTWIYSLGTCHINGNFEQGTIELIVTTYQAAVLLLFNTWDKLSCREIATKLNLSEDDIVRILRSLSCARYKILTKEPETETISPSDVFEFNSKFTDKMRSIKMPLLPTVEKKKVVEVVDKDRRSAIDASIVRIMKSRKVLSHEELVTECVQQLRRKSGYNWFVMESTVELRRKYQLEGDSVKTQLDGDAVRKRIADLITREYLKRDEDNPDLLEYLEDGDVQVRCKSGSLRICYVWCSSRK